MISELLQFLFSGLTVGAMYALAALVKAFTLAEPRRDFGTTTYSVFASAADHSG